MCDNDKVQCTCCSHKEVCSYKEQFRMAQQKVENVSVSIGEGSFINLRDIGWIRAVKLECKFFSGKQQSITRGNPMNDKDG